MLFTSKISKNAWKFYFGARWVFSGARYAYKWIAYEKEIRFALSTSLLPQKLAKIAFLEVSCEILKFENSKKFIFQKVDFSRCLFRHHMVNKCWPKVNKCWIFRKFEKNSTTWKSLFKLSKNEFFRENLKLRLTCGIRLRFPKSHFQKISNFTFPILHFQSAKFTLQISKNISKKKFRSQLEIIAKIR